MNKRVDTVLFDLDGTLINTNELIITSFMHVMETYFPGQYERKDVLAFMGPPLVDTFEKIAPDRVDELVQAYRTFNLAEHDRLVTGFDGVEETVKALSEQGYKLAIVSTKRNDVVLKGLKLMKLDRYFPVVIGLDDVTKAKPDPEPLEKALSQLGATAAGAVMVGDNHHDIVGGKNAGTLTAGVSWTAKGEAYLEQFHPDVMLKSMPDLLTFLEEVNG